MKEAHDTLYSIHPGGTKMYQEPQGTESRAFECVYKFCWAVVEVFGPVYLRAPNAQDTEQVLAQNATRGFPRMLAR